METKKKFLGIKTGVLLLLLLLNLFVLSTTCYADVSTDYLNYAFEHLVDYASYSSYSTTYKTGFQNLLNNPLYITDIKNYLNSSLSSNNLSNLNDNNLIILTGYGSESGVDVYFIFSNETVPNGSDNLGYLYLHKTSNSDYFGAYNSEYIYYCTYRLTSASYTRNTSFTRTNSNKILTFWNARNDL